MHKHKAHCASSNTRCCWGSFPCWQGLSSNFTCAHGLLHLPAKIALQGRCKLLLVDNIAAHVWHDRAAVFGSHNQQLPGSTAQPSFSQHNPQQQQQRQPWTSQSSVQQQPQTGIPPGQYATAESSRGGDTEGPGIDALRVQGAVAALLQHLSQQWRLPVVVTKQTVVTQGEKAGSARLVQREILTAPLQVSAPQTAGLHFALLAQSIKCCEYWTKTGQTKFIAAD